MFCSPLGSGKIKDLHQTSMSISTTSRSGSSERQKFATTVVAAVTTATSGDDIEKQDPLLRLARILVRQAKVRRMPEALENVIETQHPLANIMGCHHPACSPLVRSSLLLCKLRLAEIVTSYMLSFFSILARGAGTGLM